MPQPLDDKFLKERYEHELARKDKISDSLGMPVSVLIVLGGLVITMIRGFSYTKLPLTIAFFLFIAVVAVSFVFCLWFFARAYHGQSYEYLPPLGELFEAFQKYEEYYAGYEGPDNAETDFEDNFRYRIITAADRNTKSNDAKQSCLHKGIVSLFVLLVATALSSVPCAVDQLVMPAKVPVMHLDNLEKETIMSPQTPAPSAPKQQQATPTTPKPQFPANIIQKNDQPVVEKRTK